MSDPLDEAIARRMRSEVPLQAESSAALGELRGPMLRARRRRAAAVNPGRAAVALLVVSAGVFGVASLDDSEPGVVAAGSTTSTAAAPAGAAPITDDGEVQAPDSSTEPPATAAGSEPGSTALTSIGPASTSAAATSAAPTSDGPTSTSPTSNPPTSAVVTSDAPASTAPTSTSSTSPDPSTSTTTLVASTGVETINTVCGSIRVSWTGDTVALDQVSAADGFDHDVKSSGPEDVEVKFDGESGRCEVKAKIVAGALSPSVVEDLEHGDGSHDDSSDSEHSDD